MLTPNQIQELKQIIDKKINIFIVQNISAEFLTTEERLVLKKLGVDISSIKSSDRLIYQSFALGIISGAVPKNVLNSTTYQVFQKYLESGKFIGLNSYEKAVISSLERQSLSDIHGIGNKYKKVLEGAIISEERQYYENTIREKITEGRAKKDSLRNISNEIRKELGSFARDFDRVLQTVSHNAFSEGREAFIRRNYGEDAEFWVQVFSGACTTCVGNYLTAGLGSEPKVFKVGSLPPPNVNYGKKKADWVTTMPGIHPYCRCTLFPKPQDYVWDQEQQQFIPGKQERKIERKSKVKVQFGDKEYEV